jgi:hypothetical protein
MIQLNISLLFIISRTLLTMITTKFRAINRNLRVRISCISRTVLGG